MTGAEIFIKELAELLEGLIAKVSDTECPHCGHFLDHTTSEDIENWLKGEKKC